ncbi:MAG: DUF2256 domain-containing protein [Tranquillimonas sp.]|jgi:hypothetical protein
MSHPLRRGELARRVCDGCGRPFTWRRVWSRVRNEVRYCSRRCRDALPTRSA